MIKFNVKKVTEVINEKYNLGLVMRKDRGVTEEGFTREGKEVIYSSWFADRDNGLVVAPAFIKHFHPEENTIFYPADFKTTKEVIKIVSALFEQVPEFRDDYFDLDFTNEVVTITYPQNAA